MRWDVVHDSREAFLVCLRAQCAPGTPVGRLPRPQLCADPDLDGAAAILLALLDPGLSLAVVGDHAAEVLAAAIRRATGAVDSTVEVADFVLVGGPTAGPPVAARARRGTARAPEAGASIVYCGTPAASWLTISGPGVDGTASTTVRIDPRELLALTAANGSPPMGVDAFVVSGDRVAAIPRSVSLHVDTR